VIIHGKEADLMNGAARILILVIGCAGFLFAHDLIILKNGEEIKAKVLEITPTTIEYKKFDDLDGPTVSVPKTEVSMVKYQDGTKDILRDKDSPPKMRRRAVERAEHAERFERAADSKPNRVGFYVNPLGFLEFGPMVGAEFTIKSRFLIDATLRFFPLGALSYVTEATGDDGSPYRIAGLGIGGAFKYLVPSRMGGFFVGGVLEYSWWTSYFAQNTPTEWQRDKEVIMPLATAGYKFRFRSGFFITAGGFLGIQIPILDQWYYTNNGDNTIYLNDKNIEPAGMFELSFGYEF
jgi:hypothetical protein